LAILTDVMKICKDHFI